MLKWKKKSFFFFYFTYSHETNVRATECIIGISIGSL